MIGYFQNSVYSDSLSAHCRIMMASPNGDIFRVTGALCGESTCHRWVPTKVSDAGLLFLLCAWTNCWANNRDGGDFRRHHAHYDVTLMIFNALSTHRFWMQFQKCNFQSCFTVWYLQRLRQCSQMNVTGRHWWEVNNSVQVMACCRQATRHYHN